eukprot:7039938-Ditylum_brightwellii.AAC.1
MADYMHPYWGINRRRLHPDLTIHGINVQQELDNSEVTQQPSFDISYPAGLTVKWQNKQKTKLATVLRKNEGGTSENMCTIRLLNSKEEVNVPVKTLTT